MEPSALVGPWPEIRARAPAMRTNWKGNTIPGGGLTGCGSTRPRAAMRRSIPATFDAIRSGPRLEHRADELVGLGLELLVGHVADAHEVGAVAAVRLRVLVAGAPARLHRERRAGEAERDAVVHPRLRDVERLGVAELGERLPRLLRRQGDERGGVLERRQPEHGYVGEAHAPLAVDALEPDLVTPAADEGPSARRRRRGHAHRAGKLVARALDRRGRRAVLALRVRGAARIEELLDRERHAVAAVARLRDVVERDAVLDAQGFAHPHHEEREVELRVRAHVELGEGLRAVDLVAHAPDAAREVLQDHRIDLLGGEPRRTDQRAFDGRFGGGGDAGDERGTDETGTDEWGSHDLDRSVSQRSAPETTFRSTPWLSAPISQNIAPRRPSSRARSSLAWIEASSSYVMKVPSAAL